MRAGGREGEEVVKRPTHLTGPQHFCLSMVPCIVGGLCIKIYLLHSEGWLG
jgi:hypothetical protein